MRGMKKKMVRGQDLDNWAACRNKKGQPTLGHHVQDLCDLNMVEK